MSMRLQKVFTGSISSDEVNFRIFGGRTTDLVEHTKCKREFINTIGKVNRYHNRPKY